MIQYWTFWNYTWYLAHKNKLCDLTPPLRTSILATSLVGGYLVYIYPKKMVVTLYNFKLKVPYRFLVFGDIIFHQYPLFYMLTNHDNYNNDVCARTVIYPFGAWYALLHYRKYNKHKIYGVNLHYLIASCACVALTYGFKYHLINNKFNLLKN